jgi:hypothetical protein
MVTDPDSRSSTNIFRRRRIAARAGAASIRFATASALEIVDAWSAPGDEIGGAPGYTRHIALRSGESVSLQNSSYSAPGHAVGECLLNAQSGSGRNGDHVRGAHLLRSSVQAISRLRVFAWMREAERVGRQPLPHLWSQYCFIV